MLSPRTLNLRHLWMVLAVLSCLVIATLSLFWVVFHRTDWMMQTLEPRLADWLLRRCVAIRCALPAIDSDGDTVPDWYEKWRSTDPQNPRSTPPIELLYLPSSNLGYVNQRMHLRYEGLFDSFRGCWRPGTRLNVQANVPVLLSAGREGTPTAGPVEVTADAESCFEIDVLAAQACVVQLTFTRPGSGLSVSSTSVLYDAMGFGYPCSPLPTTTVWKVPQEKIPGLPTGIYSEGLSNDPVAELAWPHLPVTHYVLLFTPPLPPVWQALGQYRYVLEVARGDRPDEWLNFEEAEKVPQMTSPGRRLMQALDVINARSMFPGHRGPLLFRVVPVVLPAVIRE